MSEATIIIRAKGVSINLLKLLVNRSIREDWSQSAFIAVEDNFGGSLTIELTESEQVLKDLRDGRD